MHRLISRRHTAVGDFKARATSINPYVMSEQRRNRQKRAAARSGAAAIILTGRNRRRGTEAVSEFLQLGAKAAFVAADLDERDAPEKIVSAAIDQFGRLDGLVNAAALSDRGSIADAENCFV